MRCRELARSECEKGAFIAIMLFATWTDHIVSIWSGTGAADRTNGTSESKAGDKGHTPITASALGNWLGENVRPVLSVSGCARGNLEAGIWHERTVIAVTSSRSARWLGR